MPKLTAFLALALCASVAIAYDVMLSGYTQLQSFSAGIGHMCAFRDGSGYYAAEYADAVTGQQEICVFKPGVLLPLGCPTRGLLWGGSTALDKGVPEFDFHMNALAFEIQTPGVNTPGSGTRCTGSSSGNGYGWATVVASFTYNNSTPSYSIGTPNLLNGTAVTSCDQGSLHPRFTKDDAYAWIGELYCGYVADCSPPESTYCAANASSCGYGTWYLTYATITISGGTVSLGTRNQIKVGAGAASPAYGWVEPVDAGGTFGLSGNAGNNTSTRWLVFTSNSLVAGQVWYNPDIAAYNISTGQVSSLTNTGLNLQQWNEHGAFTPDGSQLIFSTTQGNTNWTSGSTPTWTPLDYWITTPGYSSKGLQLSTPRRLTYRNVIGFPEYDAYGKGTGTVGVANGKCEFFPSSRPYNLLTLLVHPNGSYSVGELGFTQFNLAVSGRAASSGLATAN